MPTSHSVPHGYPSPLSLPIKSTVKQIDGLQLLRAVAVMLVVWCHAGQYLEDYHGQALPSLNVFGIDIFFVISGFILSLVVLNNRKAPGPSTSWDFLKRRLIRVYPIYWVFAVVILLRMLHAGVLAGHNYWSAFFLLPPIHYQGDGLIIGYSWTMMFEIFFYTLLALIQLKTVRWAVPILILLLTTSVAVGGMCDIRHPFWIVAANPVLLEFVFGALLALLYARVGAKRHIGMCLTALGIIASFWLAAHNQSWIANGAQMILINHGAFQRAVTWGLCALLLVAGVVFWSPSMHHGPARWWVILGNASYSTYIISQLVLEFGSRAFLHFRPDVRSMFFSVLYAVTMLAANLVAGYFCYRFIEKPLLNVLQDRFLVKPKAPGSRSAHHAGHSTGFATQAKRSGESPLASTVSNAIPADESGEIQSRR
jgi:exopolysaccharide production protein ExoZ